MNDRRLELWERVGVVIARETVVCHHCGLADEVPLQDWEERGGERSDDGGIAHRSGVATAFRHRRLITSKVLEAGIKGHDVAYNDGFCGKLWHRVSPPIHLLVRFPGLSDAECCCRTYCRLRRC